MLHRNGLSKVAPLSLLAAALMLAPDQAQAGEYRALCTSAGKACVYTGPEAPVLSTNVCWNGVDVRLKGSGSCAAGSWPYYVDFGEVIDPVLGLVIAYIPLDDACDMGSCSDLTSNEGPFTAEPMCCYPGQENCTPNLEGQCPNGKVLVWCQQPATNDDGSVACFY